MITVADYPVTRELLLDLTRLRAPFGRFDRAAEPRIDTHHTWQLHFHSDASANGYDGALFSSYINGKPTYVIFHQGSNDRRDFPTLMKLANQKMPQQLADAHEFTQEATDFIHQQHPDEEVDILHVGYSLGAALAILTCHDNQPVIAIESPGVSSLLEKLGRSPQNVGKHVLEILSPLANLVNAHGSHIGQILQPGERDWDATECSLNDFLKLTAESHRLSDIRQRIIDEPELTTTPANEVEHADTVFEAFQEYLGDCKDHSPSFRLRLQEALTDLLVSTKLDDVLTTAVLTFGEHFPDLVADLVFGKEHSVIHPVHPHSKQNQMETSPDDNATEVIQHPNFRALIQQQRQQMTQVNERG